MRHKKLKLSVVLLLGLGLTGLQAQVNLNASGGNASGTGGTVSYSIGQVVYTTNNGGANGSVAQGVQQPYEISVVTAIKDTKGITLQCSAYPNPVAESLKLKIESSDFDFSTLSFQLFDITGKLLESRKIESNETNIFMKNLVPATYFIKITDGSKEIKTFKINKNWLISWCDNLLIVNFNNTSVYFLDFSNRQNDKMLIISIFCHFEPAYRHP